MTKAVSVIRCADYLGVTTKQVRAAIELGLVTQDEDDNTVVPRDVFAVLVKIEALHKCPCCGMAFDTVEEAKP